MKVQLTEMMKMMVHSGSSSVVALVNDSKSPFAERIQTSLVPQLFKLPTLESYDGPTDPIDHQQQYGNMIGLQNVPDGIICKAFVTTLKGATRMWCNSLSLSNSIQCSQKLETKCISHFLGTRKQYKQSTYVATRKVHFSGI